MSRDLLTTPEAESSPAISTIGAEGVHEFIRYAVASGVALVADVCSLYVLTSIFSVPYLISGAISFGIGLIIVYVLSILWVFDHHVLRDARIEFVLFALIGVIGLGLNELVLWVLTGFFAPTTWFRKVPASSWFFYGISAPASGCCSANQPWK